MLSDIAAALAHYETILEPDENIPEWWAGAPSVTRGDDGTFYLAARMREGRSPRGLRGYCVRILASPDGRHFTPIHELHRDVVGVPVFERPALARDPHTGRFKLYLCSGLERGWTILKLEDAERPDQFDPQTVHRVLWEDYPEDGLIYRTGHKDPFVFWDGAIWHMFTIGTDRVERIAHHVSEDGEQWQSAGPQPVLENTGWHNFYTRPACVVPLRVGYLFVYEGSHLSWHDPVYNIATGLAYSPDLRTFYDLTPDAPLLQSTTPGSCQTWRYSHWLPVENSLYVYFEAARPNNTNEIRMGVITPPVW